MRIVFHQFKTDLRCNFVSVLLLWAVLAIQAFVLELPFLFLLFLVEVIIAGFLVIRLIQSDPLAGTTGFWQTRPIDRAQLVFSKTCFIALLIIAPYIIAHVFHWIWFFQMPANLLKRSLFEVLLRVSSFIFLIATVAALTPNMTQALGAFAKGFVLFLLWNGMLAMTGFFRTDPISTYVNGTVAALIVFALCMAVAWGLQSRRRYFNASIAMLVVGALAFLPIKSRWSFAAVPWPGVDKPAATNLSVAVLSAFEPFPKVANSQLLWSHLQLRGLSDHEFARVSSIQGDVVAPQIPKITFFEEAYRRPMIISAAQPLMLHALHDLFPAETVWSGPEHIFLVPDSLPVKENFSHLTNPPVGRIQGKLDLDLFELEKLVDVKFSTGGTVVERRGERFHISFVSPARSDIKIRVEHIVPNLLAVESLSYRGLPYQNGADSMFVLYSPESKEGFISAPNAHFYNGGAVFGDKVEPLTITFPFSPMRARLTGVPPEKWIAGAHFMIFRPLKTRHASVSFYRDNYPFVSSFSFVP